MAVISVQSLQKSYRVHQREAGLGAALKSLVVRKMDEVRAVDSLSFQVEAGEVVGFLGPNGAGKTTSLKMLAGLLHPSGGAATVLGFTPERRERGFLSQITLVMGQRNQLVWDIPAIDSFELNRAIYRIPQGEYKSTLDELTALLGLEPILNKPVRNLSLGERMKCEIAGALLHRPRVLFLDEPTIGLDVTAQKRIREFIAEYNRRNDAAVLLTSHYMADVEALCKRVIVIHHGKLLFDGDLSDLVAKFAPTKTITVQLEDDQVDLSAYGEVISREEGQITLRVARAETTRVTTRLLADMPVTDFTVQDPPIEDVIETVFAQPDSTPQKVS